MTKRCKYHKINLILLILCLLFQTGCSRQTEPVSRTGLFFDTVITVTLYDPGKKDLLDKCFSMAERYESLFSVTIEGSDVWNINHSGGDPVLISDETAVLLTTAISYARLTDGIVDPTIGSVSSLWDFTSDTDPRIPDDTAIRDALSHVDYRKISLRDNIVSLEDPKARIDLGFIAKGYIADQMKDLLCTNGVTNGLINLGGNVLAIGSKPDGDVFHIGIQKPFADPGESIMSVEIKDRSVVSSGTYCRYFEKDGTLYHHLLDPHTGYPASSSLQAVTILSDHSVDGDALSTACFLLGLEDGMELILKMPDTDAIFITSDGEVISSLEP